MSCVKPALRLKWRVGVTGVLFVVWLLFVLQIYIGTFFHYSLLSTHFLNRPLVQAPFVNFIPDELEKEVKAIEANSAGNAQPSR